MYICVKKIELFHVIFHFFSLFTLLLPWQPARKNLIWDPYPTTSSMKLTVWGYFYMLNWLLPSLGWSELSLQAIFIVFILSSFHSFYVKLNIWSGFSHVSLFHQFSYFKKMWRQNYTPYWPQIWPELALNPKLCFEPNFSLDKKSLFYQFQ